MGRTRLHDPHLPKRVRRKHGAFYYLQPVREPIIRPDGRPGWKHSTKWIPLGHAEAEMWATYRQAYAERGDGDGRIGTIGDLLDAYVREVVPTQKPNTGRGHVQAAKPLRAALGHIPVAALRPKHLYGYRAARARKAPTRANREISTMVAALHYAIELGLRDDNPAKIVRRLKERPRERLPLAWELAEVAAAGPPMLRAYIPLKLLLGIRQGDMLALTKAQIVRDGPEAGIAVRARKTGKRKIVPWSDELLAAVAAAEAVPRKVGSIYLFATRTGQPYTSDGFRSIWHRAMRKALAAGKLLESFTEHDIRASTATEAAEREGIARARELLDHSSDRQTETYVRSKRPEKIRPLR